MSGPCLGAPGGFSHRLPHPGFSTLAGPCPEFTKGGAGEEAGKAVCRMPVSLECQDEVSDPCSEEGQAAEKMS